MWPTDPGIKSPVFPIFQNNVHKLKEELAMYLAKIDGVSDTIDILKWWNRELPTWAAAAKKVLVVQPKSG